VKCRQYRHFGFHAELAKGYFTLGETLAQREMAGVETTLPFTGILLYRAVRMEDVHFVSVCDCHKVLFHNEFRLIIDWSAGLVFPMFFHSLAPRCDIR
jgi:hypothetical protein